MTPEQLAQSVKSAATDVGFDWCGICPAVSPAGVEEFQRWLEAGYHGEMEYLQSRHQAYTHPRHVMEGVQSVVMLAISYSRSNPRPVMAGQGQVARYAWGTADYHDIVHGKLKQLKAQVSTLCPDSSIRGVVDTAPLLEREFAQLAGLGWRGKNSLLLNTQAGSWFFLAALLVDFQLPADAPHETDHCGTCQACLDACPTDAFVEPGVLDARKCISYLTIELRGPIPIELREPMGQWVYGCDICQDVCPWNSKANETQVAEFQPIDELNPLDLAALFDLDDNSFRQRFRKTPLWRPKRRGMLRNAAIVLGNQGCGSAIPALVKGLHDNEPLVRGASAWALGKIGSSVLQPAISYDNVQEILESRLTIEDDEAVQSEIRLAVAMVAERG